MLSFQEQYELINSLYDYEIDENAIKAYITRGTIEEQMYNKRYIISALKYKLKLIDFSDGYTKLVRFYIDFFIINNEVYYYDSDHKNKVYELPTSTTTIYDVFTNESIITYNHESTDVLIFYPAYVLYHACNVPCSIGYHNPEKLKDIDSLVIKDQYEITGGQKLLPYLESISRALKDDEIDLFIDVCVQFPNCVNSVYIYKHTFSVSLFELTILFNSIKCFKYMILNNYYDVDRYYTFFSRAVAVSNNFEMIRLLENAFFNVIVGLGGILDLIDYHRNDVVKYILLKYPINNEIGHYFGHSLSSYNYELMLYILENYDYIPNVTPYYGYNHMPAILYALNKYNIEYAANWLDMIPVLISLPFSADAVMDILKRVPSYVGRAERDNPWVNIPKTCLISCFQYKKSYEYINTIINFIYGSPKIEYNYMNWYRFRYNRWTYFTPLTVLDALYKRQVDVDIIMFIKVMFYKGYDYNKYNLKMISLLMRRKENKKYLKKLAILMQYYAKQYENYRRERMRE